jgi:HEAT repeat protein
MSRRRHSNSGADSIGVVVNALRRDGAAAATVEPLSDLSRAEARELRELWPGLEGATRFKTVALMASLGAEDVRFNFERALLIALADQDPEIRVEAAGGLWETESSAYLEALLERLPNEPSPRVRAVMVEALGRFARLASDGQLTDAQSAMTESALLRATESDPDEVVRLNALAAVAYLRPAHLIASVEFAFDEGDEAARIAAVRAMGRYGGRNWASRIIDALRVGDSELRAAAALAAPYVEDRRVIPFLFEAAEEHEETDLQLAAIAALGDVGGEQVRRFLEQIKDSSESPVSNAAEDALANASLLEGADLV